MRRLFLAFVPALLLAAVPVLSAAEGTHVVRKGDTLGRIARHHGTSIRELKAANGLNGSRLSIGMELAIPGPETQAEGSTLHADAPELPTEAELSEVARAAESAAGLPAEESLKNRVIRVAERMLFIPYRWGGETLKGLDCSAYVRKVFAYLDLDLPRSAREQFREGVRIEKADLSVGDLVFFRTYAKYPSHVGIYLGDNRFIHASSRDRRVKIDNLEATYYVKRYIGAKRLLFEENDIRN
ncbi:MAG TPA: NlpC/P60 family protein [Candidatus Deferrimicrobiaceae bacterium]